MIILIKKNNSLGLVYLRQTMNISTEFHTNVMGDKNVKPKWRFLELFFLLILRLCHKTDTKLIYSFII